MMTAPIVTFGLGKRYGSTIAVDDLSLRVGPGEIYGFLGLNGAGKTTTIRLLLGMIRPDGGWVDIFGTRIRPGIRDVWASTSRRGLMSRPGGSKRPSVVGLNRRYGKRSASPSAGEPLELDARARSRRGRTLP